MTTIRLGEPPKFIINTIIMVKYMRKSTFLETISASASIQDFFKLRKDPWITSRKVINLKIDQEVPEHCAFTDGKTIYHRLNEHTLTGHTVPDGRELVIVTPKVLDEYNKT